MSSEGNGATWVNEPDDEFPELAELQLTFARLLQKRVEAEESEMDEAERNEVREEIFKEQMRASFMTHELATEADFNRLWPRLRDDILCENAASVYLQVMDALAEEFDDDDDE